MSILHFPSCNKPFHVHVDASGMTISVVLALLGEGNVDHPMPNGHNYTTTYREALSMVYKLHKFR